MLIGLINVVILAVILQYAFEYRIWTSWDKKLVYKNRPGPCKTVVPDGGSEDVTYIGDNIVLFSKGVFGSKPGSINSLNLTDDSVYQLDIVNVPKVDDFMLKPHGIYVWTDPYTGQQTLFVITHPAKGDRVEVFDILTPLALRHKKSIADAKFGFMNDLVAIDSERFYITQIFRYTDVNKYAIEFYLRMTLGNVMFYDGRKARVVADGLFMANGINISPDKQVVYVAEFGFKKVIGYKRVYGSNNLAKIWEYDMDTGVDNIEVDHVTGDLWIGCHPLTWTRMDVFDLFNIVSPGQVLHVKMADNMVDRVSEVYSDDGTEATGTCSATLVNGRLVIGTAADQLVVCDTKSELYG